MRVNVVKPANNSGLPSVKYGYLYVALADDVALFPAIDQSGVVTIGDIVLKENARFDILYLTPSKQKINTDTTGELESRGFIQKIAGSHPGDDIHVNSFLKHKLNEPLIIVAEICGAAYRKILGSPGNPMYLSGNFKDDSSDKLWEISFEKAFADETPVLYYGGILVADMVENPDPPSGGFDDYDFIDLTQDY